MLEGKNVNLRIMEKEDLPLFADWLNTLEVFGECNPLRQVSRMEADKILETPLEMKPFIIERKDGSKLGFVAHFHVLRPGGKLLEIGYSLVPKERWKGYCTEAVQIMVDYLFLSRDVERIQASTDTRNLAPQKVLEKVGFKKEGTVRRYFFIRGQYRDSFIYSIIREEWKASKILRNQ